MGITVESLGKLSKFGQVNKFSLQSKKDLDDPIKVYFFKQGDPFIVPIEISLVSNLLEALKGYHYCSEDEIYVERLFFKYHLQPGAINDNSTFSFLVNNDWIKERQNKCFEVALNDQDYFIKAQDLIRGLYDEFCTAYNDNGVYYSLKDGNIFLQDLRLSSNLIKANNIIQSVRTSASLWNDKSFLN